MQRGIAVRVQERHAAQASFPGPILVGQGEAPRLLDAGEEGRVVHAEGTEKALLKEIGERLARGDLDHAPEHVEAGVVIGPGAARDELQRLAGHGGDPFGERHLDRGQAHVGQPIGVREQVAQREVAVEVQGQAVLLPFRDDPAPGELGQMFLRRVIEREPALIGEHQHGRVDDRLGHRRDPEEIVLFHRPRRLQIGVAHGVPLQHAAVPGCKNHGAGDLAGLDERREARDDGVCPQQVGRGVHAHYSVGGLSCGVSVISGEPARLA